MQDPVDMPCRLTDPRGQTRSLGMSGLEAISEASSPQALAAAVAGAAAQVGFCCAQAMLSVPAEKPTAWVMHESSTNVISFDRAVLVGNDLSSGYDLGLGDPNQDPVALQLRQSPAPIVWSYEDYFHAGMEYLGDWWRETDKGFGAALAIPILIDEFRQPPNFVLAIARRERIQRDEHVRLAGDIALLALHAAVGGRRSLVPALLSAWRADSPLTPTMRRYLTWAESGKAASETADIVGRKYGTVKNVLAQALERLGCTNKTYAIRLARAKGWL